MIASLPHRLCLAVFVGMLISLSCQAQHIEPRRWSNLPIGADYGGVGYAYTSGDILLNPALRIENMEFELHTYAAKYIRSFELLGCATRVEISQPYQTGEWTGLLDGIPAKATRSGWADTSLRFAMNLFGSPPLSGKEFAEYAASKDTGTIFGVGLAMQLPTGQYYEDKLINLGQNRFSFSPQLGLVHSWRKWSAEITTDVSFYTDNDEFFNGRRLEQEPVFGADLHLVYTFRPGLWLATSFGYGGGGETSVNGTANNNRLSNLGCGIALGIPINRAIGLKFAYIGNRTQVRNGLNSDAFAIAASIAW